MTLSRAASDHPEPNTTRRSRWWRWVFVLALGCVAFLLLHRWPIRIPLSDGRTLEFSAITTGTQHSHSEPFNWAGVKYRLSRGDWRFDVSTVTSPSPSAVLWFHEPATFPPDLAILAVDRNGWRWGPDHGRQSQVVYIGGGGVVLDDFENRGKLTLEVYDRTFRKLLGAATIPVPMPEEPPRAPPIELPPLPLHKTAGPWSFDIRAVQVQVRDEVPSRSHVEIQFDSRCNGQPRRPLFFSVTVRDSVGRARSTFMDDEGTFITDLSPYETVWDLDLDLFPLSLSPDDPVETFQFEPAVTADEPVATWDSSLDGQDWRLIVAAPGRFTVPFRAHSQTITLEETVPVIVVELPPNRWTRSKITPIGPDGAPLPIEQITPTKAPENIVIARCPSFDPTAGHPLRIGLDIERHIQFSVRPEIRRPAGPPAALLDGLR